MALLWFTQGLCILHELAQWPYADLSIVGQTGNTGGGGRLWERIGTSWMREWNSPVLVWGTGEMLGPDSEVNEQEQLLRAHGTWYSYLSTLLETFPLTAFCFLANHLIDQSSYVTLLYLYVPIIYIYQLLSIYLSIYLPTYLSLSSIYRPIYLLLLPGASLILTTHTKVGTSLICISYVNLCADDSVISLASTHSLFLPFTSLFVFNEF